MTKLADVALEEYKARNLNVVPMYPSVLVRVLPKEQQRASGLWMPDTKETRSRTVFEGIVLRTFEAHTVKINNKYMTITSHLAVGDHVLFPHWSGEPVPWLIDEATAKENEEYRLVPERGYAGCAGNKESGEIFMKVAYEEASPMEKLRKIIAAMEMEDLDAVSSEDANFDLFYAKLREDFDIIPKVTKSQLY